MGIHMDVAGGLVMQVIHACERRKGVESERKRVVGTLMDD